MMNRGPNGRAALARRARSASRPSPIATTLDTSRPIVVKLGGRSLEAAGATAGLAAEIAGLQGRAVVVHGGGRDVSDWSMRLGIEPSFVDGLRVTDDRTLEVAVAVLAGLANKRLVAQLRAAGVDALGLSALDGGIAEAELHPEADRLGRVGVVREVNTSLLDALLAQGRTPVLASIGACGDCLLNLNADEVAAALAGSLRAGTLILLSDAPGVVIEGSVVPELTSDRLGSVLLHSDVKDGMVAKLHAARKALDTGAGRVCIAAWSGPGTLRALIEGAGRGTTITRATDSISTSPTGRSR